MPEIRIPAPVKAQLVNDIDEAEAVPGAIEFRSIKDVVAGLAFRCPCGCKRDGWLPIGDNSGTHPRWKWDGNRETPTLSPSIHWPGHWHGFLQAGFFNQA